MTLYIIFGHLARVVIVLYNNVMCFSCFRCPDGFMGQRCEFKNLDGSYTSK